MRDASPLIIAHRGASAVAPESTRAAIRAAVEAGADMVELDIQMTRDGRLVIFHDERLERTTTGSGRVGAASYAELARLDAGSWFHPRFAGERIVLARQALRLAPRRIGVNLELKRTSTRRALLDRVRRLIRREPHKTRLLISSFDVGLLEPLQDVSVALALLTHQAADASLRQAIRLGCRAWHPLHTLVTPRRIARAHAHDLRVHVWTVDDPRRARTLLRWGVDGIFTNDPGRLIRAVKPS